MTFCVFESLTTAGSSGDAPVFRRGPRSRICRIGALEKWCKKNPGKQKVLNVAMDRPPSPSAPRFFIRRERTPFRDRSDEWIRVTFANALTVTHGSTSARRFWNMERRHADSYFEDNEYEQSLRDFQDLSKLLQDRHKSLAVRIDRISARNVDGASSSAGSCPGFTYDWLECLNESTVTARVYIVWT